MRKRDKVEKIISDTIYNFTHLWVEGFGWETTIFLPSDFDKILKPPLKDKDGKQIFMAYNWDEENNKTEIRKFKGTCLK